MKDNLKKAYKKNHEALKKQNAHRYNWKFYLIIFAVGLVYSLLWEYTKESFLYNIIYVVILLIIIIVWDLTHPTNK